MADTGLTIIQSWDTGSNKTDKSVQKRLQGLDTVQTASVATKHRISSIIVEALEQLSEKEYRLKAFKDKVVEAVLNIDDC